MMCSVWWLQMFLFAVHRRCAVADSPPAPEFKSPYGALYRHVQRNHQALTGETGPDPIFQESQIPLFLAYYVSRLPFGRCPPSWSKERSLSFLYNAGSKIETHVVGPGA